MFKLMSKSAHYQTLEYYFVRQLVNGWRSMAGEANLSILDFGCGHGKFMEMFAEIGCTVTGVDANADYIQRAKDKGFNAYVSDVFFENTRDKFDVIFLSHLIEHLQPDQLVNLIPRLCAKLSNHGRLVIISPTPGERFYHDFSHIRPYLPQSIRHAFGQYGAPVSFGEQNIVDLVDIYFFKDPYKTRLWRSFYVGKGPLRLFTKSINLVFDLLWRLSDGRIGVTSSWLGCYELRKN